MPLMRKEIHSTSLMPEEMPVEIESNESIHLSEAQQRFVITCLFNFILGILEKNIITPQKSASKNP